MDFFSIISILNFLVPLLLLICFYKKSKIRKKLFFKKKYGHGKRCFSILDTFGEEVLLSFLKRGLSKDKYFIFNNLLIPNKKGGTSQIDHLILSEYGIFVLENKDYNGWIFGNKYDKFWTQQTWGGKFKFYNPLRQNYGHIKSLQERIGGLDDKYFNIIAFSENSEFKTNLPDNIIHYSDVVDIIKKFNNKIIPKPKLEQILGKVFEICQTVDITNEQHIEYLKKNIIK